MLCIHSEVLAGAFPGLFAAPEQGGGKCQIVPFFHLEGVPNAFFLATREYTALYIFISRTIQTFNGHTMVLSIFFSFIRSDNYFVYTLCII